MSESVKIVVYIAVKNESKRSDLEMAIMTHYLDIAVFPMADLAEYQQRLKMNPPQLVIADVEFLNGNTILKDGVTLAERSLTSYIVLGTLPNKEDYLDEMMVNKIQFFETDPDEDGWKVAIKKSFKFSFESQSANFIIKNVKMGDLLMKVGDPAEKIYILKKGKLQAFHVNEQDQKVILGEVRPCPHFGDTCSPGEFVGEMAYFNSEPRVASVIALENSELIEIPIASFDRVIYQKPAWAMKLIETLSKRLKKYIQAG